MHQLNYKMTEYIYSNVNYMIKHNRGRICKVTVFVALQLILVFLLYHLLVPTHLNSRFPNLKMIFILVPIIWGYHEVLHEITQYTLNLVN